MDKIKELWTKNKILWVFAFILIICLIAIMIVCITFFFGGSKTTYGDRLDEIDKHPISEKFITTYEEELEKEKSIKDVSLRTMGRVIYVRIEFVDDTSLVEAESKAAASIELFEEDTLSYYDINFTLICNASDNSEGFTIMGARNVSGSSVTWNNNTKVESE